MESHSLAKIQTELEELIVEFEANSQARWLLISMPPSVCISTIFASHAAQRTQRDVLWATRTHPSPLLNIMTNQLTDHQSSLTVTAEQIVIPSEQRTTLTPRYIQIVSPSAFSARELMVSIFATAHRPYVTLLDQILFFTAEGGRPLLLLTEQTDIAAIPTHPWFSGYRPLADCFADSRIKTVVVYNGPLPLRRTDCPESLEWRYVVQTWQHQNTQQVADPPLLST